MADLVLGPLLRYVGSGKATVWVETDAPCEVEVLGRRERTFSVHDHHFALVCISGLDPGTTTPYEVALDGETRWPAGEGAFPPSVIRMPADGDPFVLAFGSCRISAPHVAPYTLRKDDHEAGREIDALRALAVRMRTTPPAQWPHALVLLGDQVYADEVSPQTRAFIRTRRDVEQPPGEQIADFDEYAALYRETWSEPTLRWLLSTVPTAMVFDDHDVHDDWNTSQAWVDEMRAKPWWQERIVGALMSYWCYQHLGNLAPEALRDDELYERVRAEADGTEALRAFARRADRETDGARWSYRRDFGGVRLVMIDTRAGRVLEPGRRSMVDAAEWRWIEEAAAGGCDHLLIGSSLPWLLERGMHELEAWNEAVCDGAWGSRAVKLGEKVRQGLDLEHWAAFQTSFRALCGLVTEVAAGRRGAAPATIVALSGDVHHAYLTQVSLPERSPGGTRVYQAVCSPFRNPLASRERRAIRMAGSKLGTWIGTALARAARVAPPPLEWSSVHEQPWFDNQVATLRFTGRTATMLLERTTPEQPELDAVFTYAL